MRDLRASTFHPPTLDMLEPLAITATLLERGLPCPTWQIRSHPSGDRAVFDLAVLEGDTRHPYRLQCEQWKLSEALLEKLQRSPFAEVRFASQVEAATDHGDHVSVEIESDGRRETLRARYAIGCDGARSAVRRSMGLPFEGLTYPETTLLVTTLFPFQQHLEGISNVSYCWKENGNFSLLRVPRPLARVDLSGREHSDRRPDDPGGARRQPADHRAAASPLMTSLSSGPIACTCAWSTPIGAGRMLLAGDAAHLNTPAGGMGLNGGIHDAFELAAALIDVLRHSASGRPPRRLRPPPPAGGARGRFWRRPTATGRACASAIPSAGAPR